MMRKLVKSSVFLLATILVLPLILLARIERAITSVDHGFRLGSELLALVPGYPGVVMRAAYYFATLKGCSWETNLGFGTVIVRRTARLGRHVSSGCYCIFGDAEIGDGTMIGSRVSIPSGKRQHFSSQGGVGDHQIRYDDVSIGDACWIGEGAIVLADVGAHSIVGAGSVVIESAPEASLIVGNPGRVVKRLPGDPSRIFKAGEGDDQCKLNSI